ncbi:LYR motif containing protein 1 isoform X2 [Heptranchias perlo]|uniref:LYR motif containing protein 1 isoform X2 n=1 Tax=Heptranchias perlo TaxID=212740 RepID=UPI003559D48A
MTAAATRCDVLGLYRRIFRIARTWQSLSGLSDDTLKEKQYIITEAKTLFRKNKNDYIIEFLILDRPIWNKNVSRDRIPVHIAEVHLPPMGLADKKGRKFKMQERLRKTAKPMYLQSHEET